MTGRWGFYPGSGFVAARRCYVQYYCVWQVGNAKGAHVHSFRDVVWTGDRPGYESQGALSKVVRRRTLVGRTQAGDVLIL